MDGRCACGEVRYRLHERPFAVHCCHCRDCQRLTGSAFVVNLWIERRFVETVQGVLDEDIVTAGSGGPHTICRCAECGTALWSYYPRLGRDTVLLRAGTLDDPASVTPDVHIFTRSKLPWVQLPAGAPVFEAFYKPSDLWPAESLERWRRNIAGES